MIQGSFMVDTGLFWAPERRGAVEALQRPETNVAAAAGDEQVFAAVEVRARVGVVDDVGGWVLVRRGLGYEHLLLPAPLAC